MSGKFRTNWIALGDVATTSSLSIGARLLLVVLLKYAGTDGRCFASQSQLANDLGCAPRTVRTYLTELKRAELISWVRKSFNGPSIYSFTADVYSQYDGRANTLHSGSTEPLDSGNKPPPNNVSNPVNESSKLQQRFETFTGKTLTGNELLQFTNLHNQPGAVVLEEAVNEVIRRGKPNVNVNYLAYVAGDIKPPPPPFVPCRQNGCSDKGYIKTETGMASCKCRLKHYSGQPS